MRKFYLWRLLESFTVCFYGFCNLWTLLFTLTDFEQYNKESRLKLNYDANR